MAQLREALAGRAVVFGAAASVLAATLYRAPVLLDTLQAGAAVVLMAAGAAGSIAVAHLALRAPARTVRRVAWELVALAGALFAAELVIQTTFPARTSEDDAVQRFGAVATAARKQGVPFDSRLRAEVVRDLRAAGMPAVAGMIGGWPSDPAARGRLAAGFYPLSNASNADIVECNEGLGYVRFHTDEYGFNNPPGLVAANNADVAVVGESHAFGYCVPPSKSVVALLRAEYPRTANFGIAGSRVLSQLAIFREYVEPLQPRTVLWFVHDSYADARGEAEEPNLTRYLDPAFSQDLLHRQEEVDRAVLEVGMPLYERADRQLRADLEEAGARPLQRMLKLREVRRLLDVTGRWRRPAPEPDLEHFEQVLRFADATTAGWGGRLIVVMLPRYGAAVGKSPRRARYEAVLQSARSLGLRIVDGSAAFRAQDDWPGLYTLRVDNHPNERGHAVLAAAILAHMKTKEGQ